MKKFKKFIESVNLSSVTVSTWVRFINTIIALLITIFKSLGIIIPPIDEALILNVVLLVFTIIAFIQGFWKNNSFTIAAQTADAFMIASNQEAERKTDDNNSME